MDDEEKLHLELKKYLFDIAHQKITFSQEEGQENQEAIRKHMADIVTAMKVADPLFNDLYRQTIYTGQFCDGLCINSVSEFDVNLVLHLPITPGDIETFMPPESPLYVILRLRRHVRDILQHHRKWTSTLYQRLESFFNEGRKLLRSEMTSWLKSVVEKAEEPRHLPKLDPFYKGPGFRFIVNYKKRKIFVNVIPVIEGTEIFPRGFYRSERFIQLKNQVKKFRPKESGIPQAISQNIPRKYIAPYTMIPKKDPRIRNAYLYHTPKVTVYDFYMNSDSSDLDKEPIGSEPTAVTSETNLTPPRLECKKKQRILQRPSTSVGKRCPPKTENVKRKNKNEEKRVTAKPDSRKTIQSLARTDGGENFAVNGDISRVNNELNFASYSSGNSGSEFEWASPPNDLRPIRYNIGSSSSDFQSSPFRTPPTSPCKIPTLRYTNDVSDTNQPEEDVETNVKYVDSLDELNVNFQTSDAEDKTNATDDSSWVSAQNELPNSCTSSRASSSLPNTSSDTSCEIQLRQNATVKLDERRLRTLHHDGNTFESVAVPSLEDRGMLCEISSASSPSIRDSSTHRRLLTSPEEILDQTVAIKKSEILPTDREKSGNSPTSTEQLERCNACPEIELDSELDTGQAEDDTKQSDLITVRNESRSVVNCHNEAYYDSTCIAQETKMDSETAFGDVEVSNINIAAMNPKPSATESASCTVAESGGTNSSLGTQPPSSDFDSVYFPPLGFSPEKPRLLPSHGLFIPSWKNKNVDVSNAPRWEQTDSTYIISNHYWQQGNTNNNDESQRSINNHTNWPQGCVPTTNNNWSQGCGVFSNWQQGCATTNNNNRIPLRPNQVPHNRGDDRRYKWRTTSSAGNVTTTNGSYISPARRNSTTSNEKYNGQRMGRRTPYQNLPNNWRNHPPPPSYKRPPLSDRTSLASVGESQHTTKHQNPLYSWVLVPKSYPASSSTSLIDADENDTFWQLSIPTAEKWLLVNSGCCKTLIRLIHLLAMQQGWSAVTLTVIKTLFLIEYDTCPSQLEWMNNMLGRKFFDMLVKLSSALRKCFVRHYFNRDANLLCHVNSNTGVQLSEAIDQIISDIRKQPRLIYKHYGC